MGRKKNQKKKMNMDTAVLCGVWANRGDRHEKTKKEKSNKTDNAISRASLCCRVHRERERGRERQNGGEEERETRREPKNARGRR